VGYQFTCQARVWFPGRLVRRWGRYSLPAGRSRRCGTVAGGRRAEPGNSGDGWQPSRLFGVGGRGPPGGNADTDDALTVPGTVCPGSATG
jgi:hypothetical protein